VHGTALLVDHVLPVVGYRQWVLSFPGPIAVRLGYDAPLLAAVTGRLARAVMQDMRRRLPSRMLFLFRLRFGLYAVLARLQAEVDWASLESEWARERDGGPGLRSWRCSGRVRTCTLAACIFSLPID
jgi:hypothetical protein